MDVNFWQLTEAGMATCAGVILGELLMEFWIGPWLKKRADRSDKSDKSDKSDGTDGRGSGKAGA